MELQVKKLHPDAVLPRFAHDDDAGMDVCTTEEISIRPGERVQVKTGLALAVPNGHVALVWDKSGVSQKAGLKTLGGVVDAGYRGEILIGLVNLSDHTHSFKKGDKIAQILIQKIERPQVVLVDELDETTRGTGGFGSTGT